MAASHPSPAPGAGTITVDAEQRDHLARIAERALAQSGEWLMDYCFLPRAAAPDTDACDLGELAERRRQLEFGFALADEITAEPVDGRWMVRVTAELLEQLKGHDDGDIDQLLARAEAA